MALVTCPECGREGVSDTAVACPNCGYPIHEHFEQKKVKPHSQERTAASKKEVSLDLIDLDTNDQIITENHTEIKRTDKGSSNSSNDSVTLVGIIIILIPIILVIWLFGSCSAAFNESRKRDQEEYRRTLESGQQKYYNGESMTQEERKAVEDFNNWKSNQ